LTVWALRRRADNRIDRWDGRTYRRVLVRLGEPQEIAVTQEGSAEQAELRVDVTSRHLDRDAEVFVAAMLDRMLGLRIDLSEFYRLSASDPKLGPLAEQFLGLKPPRFPSLFEALVNGIACQQVTLTLGVQLLNRLTASYGVAYPGGATTALAFPRPEDLVRRDPEELRQLGFSRQKGRALVELADAVAARRMDLGNWETLDDEALLERLCRLRGIGRWTAEYALLRGLGRLQIFPGDDVGARGNLQRWLGIEQALDYAAARLALKRWQPYAGLVYFHLLLKCLADSGQIS
jgi:DNA-3-methyladenine glycosylase II